MGSSTGRDFHCYGKNPTVTELQVPAAGNWLENSEMLIITLLTGNREWKASPAVARFYPLGSSLFLTLFSFHLCPHLT